MRKLPRVVFVEQSKQTAEPSRVILSWRREEQDYYASFGFWQSRAYGNSRFYAQLIEGTKEQVFPVLVSGDSYWVAPGHEVRFTGAARLSTELAEQYSEWTTCEGKSLFAGRKHSICLYCSRCQDFLPIASSYTTVDAYNIRRACSHLVYCPKHQQWETPDMPRCPATFTERDTSELFDLFRSTILSCEGAIQAIRNYTLFLRSPVDLWTADGNQSLLEALKILVRDARSHIEDALAKALRDGHEEDIVFWAQALAWSNAGRVIARWDTDQVKEQEVKRSRLREALCGFPACAKRKSNRFR